MIKFRAGGYNCDEEQEHRTNRKTLPSASRSNSLFTTFQIVWQMERKTAA